MKVEINKPIIKRQIRGITLVEMVDAFQNLN